MKKHFLILVLVFSFSLGHAQRTNISYEYKRLKWKERSFMAILNITRVLTLHQPLIGSKRLSQAASEHTIKMGETNSISHAQFNERSRKFNFMAENVEAGSKSAMGSFINWFTSKGHRQNMFSWRWFRSGIAFYKIYKVTTLKNGTKRRNLHGYGYYSTQVFK